ncbi:MAG: MXAN_5187 C-terminal domain-containing protein [Deltaproteobacteria bacterium]|nr:MXAN_5187 C-terminal domain-containing protein [Deltaproteobacteria bacterium]
MSIAEDVERLARRMDALKVEYEHYFSGRARMEPAKLRKEVQSIIARWTGQHINNTMYKFRLRNLVSRYNTLSAYWNRTLQAIEDGTFTRDHFRMEIHERERRERDEKRQRLDAIITNRGGGAQPDALYNEFLAARKECGQGDGVARQAFETFLNRQREEIQKRYGCTQVDFRVSVEGSKVRLVAKPQRSGGN